MYYDPFTKFELLRFFRTVFIAKEMFNAMQIMLHFSCLKFYICQNMKTRCSCLVLLHYCVSIDGQNWIRFTYICLASDIWDKFKIFARIGVHRMNKVETLQHDFDLRDDGYDFDCTVQMNVENIVQWMFSTFCFFKKDY